jgi:type II secretory pathway component GspD/PulD (secretin)
MAFLDDLGLILITDTPRRIEIVERIVGTLAEEQAKQSLFRFEITHVTATVARQRVLELLGSRQAGRAQSPQEAAQQAAILAQGGAGGGASSGNLSNIADRLIPDPQSNALTFRGRQDERDFITRLLLDVDKPSALTGRWFAIGAASLQIAQLGKRQALGEIVQFSGNASSRGTSANDLARLGDAAAIQGALGLSPGSSTDATGGPMFVIDPEGRGFMYFGTPQQQEAVARLAQDFSEFLRGEEVILEFYKLRHTKAEDTGDLLNAILTNAQPTASGGLLPGGGGGGSSGTRRIGTGGARAGADGEGGSSSLRRNARSGRAGGGAGGTLAGAADRNAAAANQVPGSGDALAALEAADDIAVTPDTGNNQIVVKAPRKLQPQFKRLIDRLDLRRPQVFVDCKIVAVTESDSSRLAFETQLINAQGTGGALNTNFGLGSLTTTSGTTTSGGFLSPKTVATGLGGITAAVIKSDQVPIVLTAVANSTDARIISSPKLLVDDNEEASVSSINRVPTSTTSQNGNGTAITAQGADAEAGTTLSVTPQISEGGYLNLAFDIELSSFTGPAVSSGGVQLAPPSQVNNLSSTSVTLPSDYSIVVGGLTFENLSNGVIKVPLLGDLPLVGFLFQDQTKSSSRTTLYVFITPRIMRDPNFLDLTLLTEGPAGVLTDEERGKLPKPTPERIEVLPIAPGSR